MADNHNNEVTAAEIIRNFGFWQSKALVEPVIVTHHGRPRLVLSSIEAFQADRSGPAEAADAGAVRTEIVVRSVLSHMTEGFVAYDEELTIMAVNTAAETFIGRQREELVGKGFAEAFPDSVRGITHERLQRSLATGKPYQFEAPSSARPGLRIAVTTFPFPGGVGVIFMNTTEQARLGENQDCYRALMDGLESHDAVAAARLDSRGRIVQVLPQLADWLGLGQGEMMNLRFYDFAPSKDRRKLQDTVETVWETHTPRTIEADFMRRQDGDLPLRLTFSAVIHDFAVQSVVMLATRAGPAKAPS